MIIAHKYTDPYIASRNCKTSDWTIYFEGSLKECKKAMLDVFNDHCGESLGFAENQSEAVRKSKNNLDGMSAGGRRVDYDSQIFKIMTKKEFKELEIV